MNQILLNNINEFIKKEFPIKRIKNNKNKWCRVIIIPAGIIHTNKKTYPYNSKERSLNELIFDEISKVVSNIYGLPTNLVKPFVIKHFNNSRNVTTPFTNMPLNFKPVKKLW